MTHVKNDNEAISLQVVEIDRSKFAIRVKDGEVSANLTQMALSFGKRPKDWLKTIESKRYLDALSSRRKILLADLVQVTNGGRLEEKGTWAYDRNVVVEFARWLNPMFSVQVNDLVWRLSTGAATSLPATPQPQPQPDNASQPANTGEQEELLGLVDRAAAIVGSKARLASRMGFSSPVFCILRSKPRKVSAERKEQIKLICRQIINEGARSIPAVNLKNSNSIVNRTDSSVNRTDSSVNRTDSSVNLPDKTSILIDICCIKEKELRLSIISKLKKGGVL